MFRSCFAVALATTLVALCPALPHAETVVSIATLPDGGQADDMHALVSDLEDWLGMHVELPRREALLFAKGESYNITAAS